MTNKLRIVLFALCLSVLGVAAQAQASTCPTNMPHCAQLSWTAPTTGGTPTSYNVYQSMANGGCSSLPTQAATCVKKGSATAPTTSFTDGPLTASTSYCYVVTAVNTFGESAGSTVMCGTTAAGTAPGTPGSIVIQIF